MIIQKKYSEASNLCTSQSKIFTTVFKTCIKLNVVEFSLANQSIQHDIFKGHSGFQNLGAAFAILEI